MARNLSTEPDAVEAEKPFNTSSSMKMPSGKVPRSECADDFKESIDQLINDGYILNLLHNRLSIYDKLEYFGERHSTKVCDNSGYDEMRHLIDSSIYKMISNVFNTTLPVPMLISDNSYSVSMGLIEKHHISFTKNMKIFMHKVPTNDADALTKLIVGKVEERKVKALHSIENDMLTKSIDTQYFSPVSALLSYILNALSQSLTNFILMFIFYSESADRTLSQLSSINVITAKKSRMNQQVDYFNKTKCILKNHLCSLSFDYKWHQKFESALTWYFVFSIIQPPLSSSHPIRHYSYDLAQTFVDFSSSKTIETDLSPYFLEKSNKIQELLEKINDYETNRLLYITTEFTDQTSQITNFGDIDFTFEFSASAAALIVQNRLAELFDLYRVSMGTFGSGLTSSVSTLMEKSFRVIEKLTKPTDKVNESFYLARANLRSKNDDWNGVYVDLQQLSKSAIAESYCYKELQTKYEQASSNRTSILDKQQRIEYLLIRSFLCTSLGEFEDAFAALLDANYMVNVMKTVSAEGISTAEKTTAYEDNKTWSEFQSSIETNNEYLQKHLHFSIERIELPKGASYMQCLGDLFEKLNILIGTFAIKYDERLHNFAFDYYLKALPSQQDYKYFDQLNIKQLPNILASFEKFLEALKECTKPEPFTLDETVFSDFVQNIIVLDEKYDTTMEQSNLFVKQYYQILKLNTHIRSLSNTPKQNTPIGQQQANDIQNSSEEVDGSKRLSDSSDEHYESCSDEDGEDSSTATSSDTTKSEYYSILSLDGGGIRGIVQAIILMEIERRTKQPIGKLFDCFAGTSTGGILACGLATREPKTAKELLRLYLDPRRFEIFKKYRGDPIPWCCKPRYSSEGLEKILNDELPSELLSDCSKRDRERDRQHHREHDLIIPTEIRELGSALFINTEMSCEKSDGQRFAQRGLWFYDTDEPKNFIHRHTCDIPLKDVIRCTSAATPCFPPKELKIKRIPYTFYDGGYKHNQPDLIALKWALNVRGIPKENIFLLSIGNTTSASKPLPKIYGLLGMVFRHLPAMSESLGERNVNDFCEDVLQQSYVRITPDLNDSPNMDDIDPGNLQRLWEATWKRIIEWDNSGKFDRLCNELLKRSASGNRSVVDNRSSKHLSYYPSRCIREPHLYHHIDNLFPSTTNLNMRNDHLSEELYKLFTMIQTRQNDKLHCPDCCGTKHDHPRPLSRAAAIGHIPAILHYLKKMTCSLNESSNLITKTERKVQPKNTEDPCHWSSLHYAAANGEILAAIYILYDGEMQWSNLTNLMDKNILLNMKKKLETETKGSRQLSTPSKLAIKNGYFLTEQQLLKERIRINRQLEAISRKKGENSY